MRLEIPEHDPLFLNTDLVSGRGPCVSEANINIKAESVGKLCWATGVGHWYCKLQREYTFGILLKYLRIVGWCITAQQTKDNFPNYILDLISPDICRCVEASKEGEKYVWQFSSASLDSSPFSLPCFGPLSTSGSLALMLSFRFWIIWRMTRKNLAIWAFNFSIQRVLTVLQCEI